MADEAGAGTKIWDDRYASGQTVAGNLKVIGDPIDYTSHPFLWRESVARRLTGKPDGDPNLELGHRYFATPAGRMLALGSGLASVEEWFVLCGFVQNCIAFEMSEAAVARGRERIASAGLADRLDLRAGDARDAGLTDGSFDVVFVQAAIHHFFEIEDMYAFMHRMLRPGGLLVFDEFVGPDRLILDHDTMTLMDEVFACLAPEYRREYPTGDLREKVLRPTIEQMIAMDPSEGVHSSKILPLTYQYFDIIERRDYGGTFMRPMFTGILPNFDFDNPKDQTVARLIILIEDILLREGKIPNCQTRVVARRRDIPRPPLNAEDASRLSYADWRGLSD